MPRHEIFNAAKKTAAQLSAACETLGHVNAPGDGRRLLLELAVLGFRAVLKQRTKLLRGHLPRPTRLQLQLAQAGTQVSLGAALMRRGLGGRRQRWRRGLDRAGRGADSHCRRTINVLHPTPSLCCHLLHPTPSSVRWNNCRAERQCRGNGQVREANLSAAIKHFREVKRHSADALFLVLWKHLRT